MRKVCLPVLLVISFIHISFAQQGKDGAKTISTNNTIVNSYAALTANAASGSTSITVNSNSAFSAGDLALIIQMQGATINGTATDSTWGAMTSYNNCGLYEFEQVQSTSGSNTIVLQCSLRNNYTASGNVQVIRVPRYTTLIVNANDTLTCSAWNGVTGGIVAVEVENSTTINTNGAINASGKGFRCGVVQNSASTLSTVTFATTDPDLGAQKGESIAGNQNSYTAFGGMYGRGAPANGGGGGDSHNAAGGGGANAGNINDWTGNGNPDITTNSNYVTAWNLEYNGFANSTSSGGGKGGYTWCPNGNNPYTTPPGNSAWGGDDRRNVGGLGGRPLDYSNGRIFCGGGGGAAQEDNGFGGNGGNGGGIVYILSYGAVSGGGSVIANGKPGVNAVCPSGQGDPPGGAGGGGVIIINSTGAISNISLFANGGIGGSQDVTNTGSGGQPDESEGAGGGGGGGYIAISSSGLTTQVAGGANGTTNSVGVAPFLPNGGTKGGSGIDTIIPFCVPQIIGINGPSAVCAGESYTYTITATCGSPSVTWTLPAGWSGSSTTDSINVIAGTAGGVINASLTTTVTCPPPPSQDTNLTVTVYPAPINPNLPKDTALCTPINLSLNAGSTGFRYLWSNGDTTNSAVVTDSGTYWLQVYNACDTLRDTVHVIQKNKPQVFLGNDTTYCSNFTRVLSTDDSGIISYMWSTGATIPAITVNTPGLYWVTVSNVCGQAADSIDLNSCIAEYILPNAFTPGSEDANSLLVLIKVGSGNLTLQYFHIYSRWGQLVFSTNDDQDKWDGRFNGLPQPIGVYVYVVSYINSLGAHKLLKGNITLLR